MSHPKKTNKSGVTFDPAARSVLFAEDWNNMGDQVEGLDKRVAALEQNGAPGSRQASFTASANATMLLDITSGVECSITMNANATLQLAYTAGGSNFAVLYIYNKPGGTLTWPNILWDTVDGKPPVLSPGEGLMSVVGIYERFGAVRGFLADTSVRVSAPTRTVPVAGGVLQLKFTEGTGLPQDTSGAGNHLTVNNGVWVAGGGMDWADGSHGRTGILAGFDVKQSWWMFEVVREIQLTHKPGHFGTVSSFSGGADAEYIQNYVNADGTGVSVTARSATSTDWSQEVLPNSLITPLQFRTAVVWVYDVPAGRMKQFVMHNGERVGHATLAGGLKWAATSAIYNVAANYKVTAGTVHAAAPVKKDYVFLKQGLPSAQDLTDTYTFAQSLIAGRSGANLL